MAHPNESDHRSDGEARGPPGASPHPAPRARGRAACVPEDGVAGAAENPEEDVRLPFFDSHRLTVDELRDELRERGEDPVGLKGVLVGRLLAHVAAGGSQELLVC